MPTVTPHILADTAALYRAAAERVIALGTAAIAARGAFHLALAGGSTPQGLYALLATPEFAHRLDWSQVQLYFGDERCVPPDHADSNYRMVRHALLDHLPQPPQVHRMAGELPPRQAAREYAALLKRQLPAGVFDLVLLGLGPDGHIASLFPDSEALDCDDQAVLANYAPAQQSWRITLTFPVLDRARHLLLLVSGAGKAAVVRQAFAPAATPPLPVQRLRPQGTLEWYLDAAAAAQLSRTEHP